MFSDIFPSIRGVWDSIVLPYIISSIANLATDGWEAVTHLRDTFVVLCCFVCGCSHKNFPLSRSAVEAKRAALAAASGSTSSSKATSDSSLRPRMGASPVTSHRRGYHAGSEEDNDADSEAEFPSDQPTSSEHEFSKEEHMSKDGNNNSNSSGSGVEDSNNTTTNAAPFIQRRLLLGKKGEIEEWLPALRSRLLIPHHHPLSYSRSLHQLVGIVIGPIQQPTVSTMPTRHPEPQWPPHFLRTGGGPNDGSGRGDMGDPSTDEYSSSNSSATPRMSRHRSHYAGAVGSTTRYRQASSVVYQRVSSRNLDFSSSRVAPHLIASITAHHVLSYPATRQKVLVMDLDETLCYVSTTTANMAGPPTFSEVIPTASGAELFHVWQRPYARLFLSTVAKLFNLVLFTSASKPYADTILQRIDPDHLLKLRYYRQDCRLVPRGLLKKMCAVAGMRGVSTGAIRRPSSDDHARAAASLLVPLSTGTGDGGPCANASTTNTEDDDSGSHSSNRPPYRNWGGARTPDGHDVAAAEKVDATSTTAAGTTGPFASTRGLPPPANKSSKEAATTADDILPGLEKTLLNEHSKVLVKDLRVLKVPPELLLMIDNSEECTLVNPENALIVSPFIPSLTKGPANEKTSMTVAAAAHPARGVARDTSTLRSNNEPSKDKTAGSANAQAKLDVDEDGIQSADASTETETTTPTDEALLMGDDMTANEGPEEDEVLLALLPMLESLLVVPDVRSILRLGKLY